MSILKIFRNIMQEIKLKVEDKNLEVLMSILNNLKEGLISNIQSTAKTARTSQYKPKINTIIKEEDSATADTSGKYINPTAYKQRLQNRVVK